MQVCIQQHTTAVLSKVSKTCSRGVSIWRYAFQERHKSRPASKCRIYAHHLEFSCTRNGVIDRIIPSHRTCRGIPCPQCTYCMSYSNANARTVCHASVWPRVSVKALRWDVDCFPDVCVVHPDVDSVAGTARVWKRWPAANHNTASVLLLQACHMLHHRRHRRRCCGCSSHVAAAAGIVDVVDVVVAKRVRSFAHRLLACLCTVFSSKSGKCSNHK